MNKQINKIKSASQKTNKEKPEEMSKKLNGNNVKTDDNIRNDMPHDKDTSDALWEWWV